MLRHVPNRRVTPQRQQARADQVQNHEGGYVFPVSLETKLRRVLILGAPGTFYVHEREHAEEALGTIREALDTNPEMFFRVLMDVAQNRLAYKSDPSMVALAMALAHKDREIRVRAAMLVPHVVQNGYELFQFVEAVRRLRGGGRLFRKALQAWFRARSGDKLAFQVLKYQGRTVSDGRRWVMRDVLRLAHPNPNDFEPDGAAVLRYVAKGEVVEGVPDLIRAYEAIKRAGIKGDVDAAISLIREYRLPWELVPGELLRHDEAWKALLPYMPARALLRNLGQLAARGLLNPFTETEQVVLDKLGKLRAHPFAVFLATYMYAEGRGFRGRKTWDVNQRILRALDTALRNSYGDIPVTEKRLLLALDVSPSMQGSYVHGTHISALEAEAALVSVLLATQPNVHVVAFKGGHWRSADIRQVPVAPGDSVASVLNVLRREMEGWGGTDCALPILWALGNVHVDEFVVVTDNETHSGEMHPFQALRMYRNRVNPNARMVVLAMTSTGFSIADPSDAGMLDIVGMSPDVLNILVEFAEGKL